MNFSSPRQNYGTLRLTPARARAIQLEWAFVETPMPHARFLDFPCADLPAVAGLRAERRLRFHKRPLAA